MKNRPACLDGITYHSNSGCCELFTTINFSEEGVEEVFVSSNGSQCPSLINGMARLISLCREHDIPISEISRTLSKVRCPQCVINKESEGQSCPALLGDLLRSVDNAK